MLPENNFSLAILTLKITVDLMLIYSGDKCIVANHIPLQISHYTEPENYYIKITSNESYICYRGLYIIYLVLCTNF